jgi:hypothetical protein
MPVITDLQERPIDFAVLIQTLYTRKFTGAIVLNFSQGVPLAVDVPSVQIRLVRLGDLDKTTG